MFFHHTLWASVFTCLRWIVCRVNAASQPCLRPPQWSVVTLDAGVFPHLLKWKLVLTPPGWEIQRKILLMSRISATNLNSKNINYTAFKQGLTTLKVAVELKFIRPLTGTLLFFWQWSCPDSDLSTAKSICCLIIKLNHIDHTLTAGCTTSSNGQPWKINISVAQPMFSFRADAFVSVSSNVSVRFDG